MSTVLGFIVLLGSFGLLWGAIAAPRRSVRVTLGLIGVFVFLMLGSVWVFAVAGKDQPVAGDSLFVAFAGVYYLCAIWSLVLVFVPMRGSDYQGKKHFSRENADLKPRSDR